MKGIRKMPFFIEFQTTLQFYNTFIEVVKLVGLLFSCLKGT